tara:strand:- start:894 stop:1316 length:423 start_codon:yes stop_codon:yes gene_type:complete
MLILLSDVNSIIKVETSGTILSTAVQGTYVAPDGTAPGAGKANFQIWTESDKNAAGAESGWTPDFSATGAVTLLAGSYRAKTDQTALTSVASGDQLMVNASGLLVAWTAGNHVSAIAIGIEDGVSFKGSSYDNVLEYITV